MKNNFTSTRNLPLAILMLLMSLTGTKVQAQSTGCEDTIRTFPWEPDIATVAECWSQPDSAVWSLGVTNDGTQCLGLTLTDSDNMWLISPELALPNDTTGLTFEWVETGVSGSVYYHVLVSTDGGATFDTLLNHQRATNNWKSVSLADYAGQTIRLAFRVCPRTINSDFTFFIWYMAIYSPGMPQGALFANSVAQMQACTTAEVGDTIEYTLYLTYGYDDSTITAQWSSTMMQAGAVIWADTIGWPSEPMLRVVYSQAGRDTVTVTAANALGSITRSVTLNSVVCETLSIPFEERFEQVDGSYNACWMFREYTRSTPNYYFYVKDSDGTTIDVKNNFVYLYSSDLTIPSSVTTSPIQMPTDADNVIMGLDWSMGGIRVLVSPTGDAADSAFTDTLGMEQHTGHYAASITYGNIGGEVNTSRYSLAAYGGNTIRLRVENASQNWYYQQVVLGLWVDYDTLPVVSITLPNRKATGDTAMFVAHFEHGSDSMLAYTWHSTIMDTTWTTTADTTWLLYTVGGEDSITLVATNVFGSDTATGHLHVKDCTPADTLPWRDDMEDGLVCWTVPEGSNWNVYQPVRRNWSVRSGTIDVNTENWLISKPVSIPTDTNLMIRLFWDDASGHYMTCYYRYQVLATTATDPLASTAVWDTLYTLDSMPIPYHGSNNDIYTRHSVSMNHYAGQTIHVAFLHQPCGTHPTEGYWMELNIDNVEVRSSQKPVVRLTVPTPVSQEDSISIVATLDEGSTSGISFSWHSTMLDSSWTDTTAAYITSALYYSLAGRDTITVVASNTYGSDTATVMFDVIARPLPELDITAVASVMVGDTVPFSVSLNDCSLTGLSFTWHSAMFDSTWTIAGTAGLDGTSIHYTTEGVDTVSCIVSNNFGSDTASVEVSVTNCGNRPLPYYMTFDNIEGTLPECWYSNWNGSNAAYAPHVIGTNGYQYLSGIPDSCLIMLAGSATGYGNRAEVVLPRFADSLQNLTIAFDYWFENTTSILIAGYVSPEGDFISIDTVPNHKWNYTRDTVSFASATHPLGRIAFRFEYGTSWYAVIIDNIEVSSLNSIQAPATVTVDSIGANHARVNWSEVTGATAYNVQIDGVIDTTVAALSLVVTGLASNTQYSVRVAAIANGDMSIYTTTTFSTPCSIAGIPWFEDFEGDSPLACWTGIGAGGFSLPPMGYEYYYSDFCHSGSNALRIYTMNHSSRLYAISPEIEAPGDELLISFWASCAETGADSIDAGVLTMSGDTTSFVPLITCHLTTTPARFEFDTRGTISGNHSLAFRLKGESDALFIDDISIEQLSACARPRVVESYAIGATTAVVEWQYDTASALPNTGALVTLADISDTTASPVTVTATGSSYTFGGLVPGHQYTATVQALCSADTSAAISTIVVPSGNVCSERVGTESSNNNLINCDRPYSYSQTLYPAVLAATIDTLYGIAYHLISGEYDDYQSSFDISSDGPRIVDVYIGQTSSETLSAPISASSLTLAVQNYELPLTDTGWVRINFTNPVPLDGEGNLIVTLDDNTGAVYGMVYFGYHSEDIGTCFRTTTSSYNYSQTYDPYNPSSFNAYATPLIPDIQLLGGCASDRCLQPIVSVTDEGENSITVEWAQRGSETLWSVEYKIEGDSSWILYDTTSNTIFTLSGLNNSTAYRVRVNTLCTDEVIPSDELRAHTLCGVASIPYYQTFRADYMPSSVSHMEGAVDCWQTGDISLLSQERGLWNTHQNGDYIISPELGADMDTLQVRLVASGSTFFNAYLKVGICDADGDNLVWMDSISLVNDPQEYTVELVHYPGSEHHLAIGGSYETWTLYDVAVEYAQLQSFQVALAVNDTTMGAAFGEGAYHDGQVAIISATPFEGFHFEAWDDGDTNSVRQVLVKSDTLFTAIFAPDPAGIDDALLGAAVSVYPNPATSIVTVSIDGSRPRLVTLLDMSGREVMRLTPASSTFNIYMERLPRGSYFIRITSDYATTVKKIVLK